MKNEKEFQELVDRDLSGLVWDERKRQRVLHAISEEEKPMKKKASFTFILVAVILCISVAALAAGLVFSRRVDTVQLADEALLNKYGITSAMQTYFSRTVEEDNGRTLVHYDGFGDFTYVLGNYTVTIQNGKAEAIWSRDGEDMSGGFDADAWGPEQLTEMMRINRETFGLEPFRSKAIAIAESHGLNSDTPHNDESSDHITEEEQNMLEEKAKAAAKLSLSEMEAIAREAIGTRYNLPREITDRMLWQVEESWYMFFGDENVPCYEFWFSIGYGDEFADESFAGIYFVTVNVETGVVEDIMYESDLSSNG